MPDHRDETGDEALLNEIARLQGLLDEREQQLQRVQERSRLELQQARQELAQARLAQEELAEALHARQTVPMPGNRAVASGNTSPRWWYGALRRPLRSLVRRPLMRDVQMLRQSDLFDPDWYLAEYPDVANAGADPAIHYLQAGAFEGRNPGPRFNTQHYLLDHPELREDGMNPLIHFLRQGRSSAP